MDSTRHDQAARSFLTTLRVGDTVAGIVADSSGWELAVTLDGFPSRPLGTVGSGDRSWGGLRPEDSAVGRRITAEVTAVDPDAGTVQLAMTATEHPELWRFLKGLNQGDILSGTVASIERFGVFVALDEGPAHPIFPGVGLVTYAELSWRHGVPVDDLVRVGQRVRAEFLQFDTWNGEARLSLKARYADPWRVFAEEVSPGEVLRGRVGRVLPFGVLVEVAEDVHGLLHNDELDGLSPEDLRAGDEISAALLELDLGRRRLTLTRRPLTAG